MCRAIAFLSVSVSVCSFCSSDRGFASGFLQPPPHFYVYAQRSLGAARTSAYYAIAPFIGTLLSLIIFRDMPKYTYFIALALMIVGAWLCSSDEPIFKKK